MRMRCAAIEWRKIIPGKKKEERDTVQRGGGEGGGAVSPPHTNHILEL
jgi:hypothetical protein